MLTPRGSVLRKNLRNLVHLWDRNPSNRALDMPGLFTYRYGLSCGASKETFPAAGGLAFPA